MSNFALVKKISAMALPMVFSALLIMLTQTGNAYLMGHSTNPRDLYWLSLYQPFAFLIIAILEMFDVTNQVLVSRKRGENSPREALMSTRTSAWLATSLIAVFALFTYFFSGMIAGYYKVESGEEFGKFFFWMSIAYLPVVLNSVFQSALRGWGKTGSTFFLVGISTSLTLFLVHHFLWNWNLGVFGVPIAVGASALVVMPVSWFLLRRELGAIDIGTWSAPKQYYPFLLSVGVPIFISLVALFFSSSLFNKILLDFGENAISGFFIGFRIQSLFVVPAVAFGSGIAILMNQSIGSGEKGLAYRVCITGLVLTGFVYLGFSSILTFSKSTVIHWFTSNLEVEQVTLEYLKILAPSYILVGPMIGILTIMEQIGRGVRALVINLVSTFAIVAAAAIATSQSGKIEAFFWVMMLGNLATFVFILFELRQIRKALA